MKQFAGFAVLVCTLACAPPPEEVETSRSPLVVGDTSVNWFGTPGGVNTSAGPMLAYAGTDGRINILTPQNPGTSWNKVVLSEWTNGGVSLQNGFDGKVHMAWVGSDARLNVMRTTDGNGWTDKASFGGQGYNHGQTPSLIRWNGGLALFAVFFAGSNNNNYIVHRWDLRNGSWVGPVQMTEGQGIGLSNVSAASFLSSGDLVLGMSIGSDLKFRRYNSAGVWNGLQKWLVNANGTLFTGPSLGSVVAVTRLTNGGNRVEAWESTDGLNFTRIVSTNHFSHHESEPIGIPPLTSSSFTFAHVGTDPNRSLNFNTVPR